MIQYKYNLDKSSKKFLCPKCNKKTFVKYIESNTGNYLSENFGRCDRESNCGHYSTPTGEYENTFEYINIQKPEPSFHSYNLVNQCGRNYKQNNFVQFLKTIFSEGEVREAIHKYLIGTSKRWDGATVFWQIDNLQGVHAGKILQYHSETGKRYKDEDGKGAIDWVHSILKRTHVIPDFNLFQCLFGLHLINESDTQTLALVESEKTAVIMSLYKPEYIWLATGSKQGFKRDMLRPLKKYKIVAFPDKSEYSDWLTKAQEMNKLGFNIIVNDWLENSNYDPGTDLADVYIIEKYNIKNILEKEIIYSNSEYEINKIENKYPIIWDIINTFDLIDISGNNFRKIQA